MMHINDAFLNVVTPGWIWITCT